MSFVARFIGRGNFTFNVFNFRAVFWPFRRKIRKISVIAITVTIILCTLALQIPLAMSLKCEKSHLIYVNHKAVQLRTCREYMRSRGVYSIIRNLIGIWTPMLVTVGGVYPSVFETEETGRNQKKQLFARLKQTDDSDITDLYHSPDCFLHLLFARCDTVYCW